MMKALHSTGGHESSKPNMQLLLMALAVTFAAAPAAASASADAVTLVEKLGGKYKRTVSFAGHLLLQCDATNASDSVVAALKDVHGGPTDRDAVARLKPSPVF